MAKSKKFPRNENENSLRERLRSTWRGDFLNLLGNAVIIKGAPEDVPERWIKKLIFENGEFAYYNDMCLEISGNSGYFIYDEPTRFELRAPNRETTFFVNRGDMAWIGANYLRKPITDFLDMQVNKIVELEISMLQNLFASRSPDILGVTDKSIILSIMQAMQQKYIGMPAIYLDNGGLDGENVKQIKLSAEFNVDKYIALTQQIVTETLAHYGILSATSDKKERVQVGELEATGDFAYDAIYSIIDYVNRDAEKQDCPIRLEFNGALDDFTANRDLLPEDGEQDAETDNIDDNREDMESDKL